MNFGTLQEKITGIFKMKTTLDYEKLCSGLPHEFVEYFHYVTKLHFFEKPNYSFLEGLFLKMMKDAGFKNDGLFDWIKHSENAVESIQESYNNDITDEFIHPIVMTDEANNPIAKIEEGDVVLSATFGDALDM